MLTKNDLLICDILKASLVEDSFVLPEDMDWEYIGQELAAQTVAALPVSFICGNSRISQEIKEQWQKIAYGHIARWSQILYAQDELVKMMSRYDIPMVIMKGIAAAMYYPIPEYRSMGDVDFLVSEKDYRKAYELMLENGYVLAGVENRSAYHYELRKNGIIFELHRSPVRLDENVGTGIFMEHILTGMNHIEWHQFDGYQVPVLPWLSNGLLLLHHIRQHLREGLGLRQIIDWMMYVSKELNDGRYHQFQAVLSEVGLEQLAITVTRMCQLYLGLREKDITWCASAKNQLCEELMEYIMEQGNFGRKAWKKEVGEKILSRDKSFAQLLKRLRQEGKRRWKAVGKCPFLGHFALFYMLFRYSTRILQRENPFRTLRDDVRASRKRKQMFEQLLS